jgi:excisionase family DNA binding protein
MEQQQMLDVSDAARFLGVKEPTIRAWVAQRRLPYYKLGGRVLLDKKELEQFREACRVEAISAK